MKKSVITIMTILFTLYSLQPVNAQVLKRLRKKAGDKLEKKAEEKMDDILNKKKKKDSKNTKRDTITKRKRKTSSRKDIEIKNKSIAIEVWRNYKFIPGEEVIFFDDLKFEEVGEFPSRWDLNEGGAEVASFDGKKTIIGTSSNSNTIFPLFDSIGYLGNEFTIDFDIFVDELSKENNNSWGYYNFIFTNKHLNSNSRSIAEVEFRQRSGKTDGYVLEYDFQLEEVPLGLLNAWHHVAISYNNGNFKLYYDEKRIANIPRLAITPEIFAIQMEGHNDEHYLHRKLNFGIKNIRIAHGGGTMYKRVISDGKYVTNGILFDKEKATIQPQSMGVINKFVTILNEYPDWKFKIIGHTDTDGSTEVNLTLSKQRAEAVKQALIAQGIQKDRLTTIGKGESEPLANNTSPEEKANNRRVEFIRE